MALDFEIKETYDTTKIIIYDLSDWSGLGDAKVDILRPECETPETVDLNKNLINTYTPSDLGLDIDDFPDGIYEITVRNVDDTQSITKKYLRTALYLKEIDSFYLKCLSKCNDISSIAIDEVENADAYLKAAFSYMRSDDADTAKKFYLSAREISTYLMDCKTCQ